MKPLESRWLGALRQTTRQLSQHWHASRLPLFLRWWQRELLGCLPRHWRERLASANREHLLHWPENGLPGPRTADEPMAGQRQVLLLPCTQVLLAHVQLPHAAAMQVHAALAFEMDKYTPFKAAQVYFDTVRAGPAERGRAVFDVTLVAALRERIDRILDEAARNGWRIDAIDALDRNGSRLNVNLLALHHRAQGHHPLRRLQLGLALLGTGLLLIAMLLWVQGRQSTLDAMSAEVDALRNDTRQLEVLRQQLGELLDTGRYVQAQKAQSLPRTALLQELTDCIPADTWLEQLAIDAQGTLTLSAQSSQASELIARMKHCTHLQDLQFQGAIQPDTSTGQDRLTLTARLRPREAPHAAATDTP
ncbi:PilN domain-containing protein [Pseudomonas asplenii]|uniref:PilN domain-containing protein n=1 Tax=Pseudomonas asplenii TaxID=53407 RepID=UPI002234A147|nr:PilN domain-containing protein [Pseudomonas asplenii]UZE27779.1 type II secretion system protein GspL [Pseudomonas asplenii]